MGRDGTGRRRRDDDGTVTATLKGWSRGELTENLLKKHGRLLGP